MGKKASILFFLAAAATFGQSLLQPSDGARAETSTAKAEAAIARLARSATGGSLRAEKRSDGAIRAVYGFRSRSYAGDAREAAVSFISEHSDLFGGIPASSMKVARQTRIGRRSFIRFQQSIEGVPLLGADLVVKVSASNEIEGLNSTLEPTVRAKGAWTLTAENATEKATGAHGGQPSFAPSAERIWAVRDSLAIPAWRVLFRSANPPGDWEYLIDAMHGNVISRQNLRMGNQPLGFAWPQNPVRGRREQVPLENLVSDRNLISEQTKIFTYLPALRGQVAPGTAVVGATRQNGHFLFDENDGRAAEVQLYWGMETASAKFRALGFGGFREPLPGVVFFQDWDAENKRFVGSNNAYFSPVAFGEGKGGMFFYLTPKQADTSLDTDVIFHEYGHAVVNELVGYRQSMAFKAINEGTADYFSSSFLDDPRLAEYAAKVFGLRTPFLRRTDNNNAWPYHTVGEVHVDGNIWSGALWDVRQELGASVTDEIVLNAVAMMAPNSEFFQAAVAAVFAAEEIYGEDTAEIVAGIMEERGILTREARVASEAKWLDKDVTGQGTISGASPGYLRLGDAQYRIEVPNRATKLNVRVRADGGAKFYIRYRVPVTIVDGRIQAEQMSDVSSDASGYLSLDNTPELQAGTYYIAVFNSTTSPVSYTVELSTDGGDAGAPPAITLLTSGDSAKGSAPSGPFLASRQFAIKVPAGMTSLSVTLEGDEDVDLYVRLGLPVVINGMGLPEADLISNSESSREDMRITGANGGPIPEGVYFFGVYNYSQATTRFSVRARIE